MLRDIVVVRCHKPHVSWDHTLSTCTLRSGDRLRPTGVSRVNNRLCLVAKRPDHTPKWCGDQEDFRAPIPLVGHLKARSVCVGRDRSTHVLGLVVFRPTPCLGQSYSDVQGPFGQAFMWPLTQPCCSRGVMGTTKGQTCIVWNMKHRTGVAVDHCGTSINSRGPPTWWRTIMYRQQRPGVGERLDVPGWIWKHGRHLVARALWAQMLRGLMCSKLGTLVHDDTKCAFRVLRRLDA